MRAVIVVVACEFASHGGGVSLVDDQNSVEQFAADGADEAFGDCVRPWCANRRLDDLDVDGGSTGLREVSGTLRRGPVIRRWSRHSRRSVPVKRSAIAFARGARNGVRMIRRSAPANTASKAAVNWRCCIGDE